MQLNRATDIALRVLMLTAAHQERQTVDELAEALSVPRNHMAKVVQRLQRLGLLSTTRGRAGGVDLAEGAVETTVGAVVRALEGEQEVVDCDDPPCPLRGACRLRGALHRAHSAFLASLDEVRLADLVRPPGGPVPLTLGLKRP
ncbi:Rrf2 family transcriptional regulator [Amycolatopsis cynarae]|uniref:Rrf2 family transcriptional regulator n=2 Tax=Amycolatopsis TaxID=1813 RepID=A0A558CRS9_9PSEU|nr:MULTISPECIES: Rrf2 family transcriptional regulator [Amycolatopsis]TVT51466.1 Rrf2 family transcriptional regulator [Amycolatopsis rhizosphaerae]WAL68464.1 Rrf2 family transcriptional regulator [Amycolatopsis sp. HUAS 11-8]